MFIFIHWIWSRRNRYWGLDTFSLSQLWARGQEVKGLQEEACAHTGALPSHLCLDCQPKLFEINLYLQKYPQKNIDIFLQVSEAGTHFRESLIWIIKWVSEQEGNTLLMQPNIPDHVCPLLWPVWKIVICFVWWPD